MAIFIPLASGAEAALPEIVLPPDLVGCIFVVCPSVPGTLNVSHEPAATVSDAKAWELGGENSRYEE
ncbi:hypothetical protein ABT255_47735 [Streptomyces mirabilis]|uniref:hypothetical protein n=1 Tax=Streptomyces mirabilis TaxID=68239 RepID=UPI003321F460